MEHEDSKIYEILLEMKEDFGTIKSDIKSLRIMAETTQTKVNEHESIISNWKGRVTMVAIMAGLFWNVAWDYVKSKLFS